MKTVMKKMFSLLLVAVMLIGVMPFAAFASENPDAPVRIGVDGFYTTITASGQTSLNVLNSCLPAEYQDASKYTVTWFDGYTNSTATPGAGGMIEVYNASELDGYPSDWVHTFEAQITKVSTTCGDCGTTYYPADGQHTCPPLTCENCNTQYNRGTTHTVGSDCCSNCKTAAHNDATCPVLHPVCQYCQGEHQSTACTAVCPTCKNLGIYTMEHDAEDHCSKCGSAPNSCPITCTEHPNYHTTCDKCKVEYVTADGHVCCDRCKELHATADCPYCSVCWPKDKVTSHKASDHCGECGSLDHKTSDHCTECGKTDGTHKTDCSHYVSSGTSKVKIYANLYTGDVLTKTVPLVVYNEDPNTSIADSIAEHKDLIYAELEDQYSGYEWSGNVYDSENEDGENMNSKVGKGINVHINAHSKENIVYLYVHNARTYDRIGIVRLHGKKVGEAVKESEVRKAVKEYFSFSSLKMYDTEKWDLYVDGKDVKSDDTLTVGSNHYVIDVKISGSAKNTSGAKADSSNPKTGDAIFAPAAVLGLSATTLAVLFYLNKKRAY